MKTHNYHPNRLTGSQSRLLRKSSKEVPVWDRERTTVHREREKRRRTRCKPVYATVYEDGESLWGEILEPEWFSNKCLPCATIQPAGLVEFKTLKSAAG